MKADSAKAMVLSLWPLPGAVVLLCRPVLGLTLVIGSSALTLAFTFTDLDKS